MTQSDTKATLSFSDGSPSIDFPVYKGSIGPDVVDIRKLYGATGKFTYDPGFMSTAACNSSITYIDGDKGELLYRGYPIEQLAVNCDFLETCYLLLNGELPSAKQKDVFVDTVTHHTMVHEHMMFATPAEDYKINNVLVRALDRILILHADHEQNASTSTVRLAGSSGANPFACIAAGIACLWGPAHGGANEAALNMLKEIGSVDNIPAFIAQVKDKNSNVKLMGFGHRVYKNFDPRAKLMRETCHEVLNELGLQNDPLFKLAMALEKVALEDEYFVSRKLYPNVDFYSGIVQSALGIPVSLFTGIFAMARTVGWIAQWNEMISDPEQKIGRPRQLFVGAPKRDVAPIAKR